MRLLVYLVVTIGILLTHVDQVGAAGVPLSLRTTWPCEPSTIYLDPAAPADVLEAVAQWHRAFRPDWTFTDDQETATVQILMRLPTLVAADGLANIAANATTRIWAVVEIDPHYSKEHGDIARHELGHVAGLEHNHSSSWWHAMSPHPQRARYSALELAWMRVAALRCRR